MQHLSKPAFEKLNQIPILTARFECAASRSFGIEIDWCLVVFWGCGGSAGDQQCTTRATACSEGGGGEAGHGGCDGVGVGEDWRRHAVRGVSRGAGRGGYFATNAVLASLPSGMPQTLAGQLLLHHASRLLDIILIVPLNFGMMVLYPSSLKLPNLLKTVT